MTIRIKIENTDAGPQRMVSVATQEQGQEPHAFDDIPPGKTFEFWLHSGRALIVREGPVVQPCLPTLEPEAPETLPELLILDSSQRR